ncbi:hypothetical protein NSPZN2_10657 [Nitrospira defluvii]|uniref:Uncharacterized protein n=1 Tax=Nitrospira defluvii TaxID=330214 RepID=A0ABM8QJH9_9BACT|nr:hypothetical protein NSPZN2_10657 [Nitrospira defluvii]
MAGTVYPYSNQDMPIRGVPDGFCYHMFARQPSIPFFTQADGAKDRLLPYGRSRTTVRCEAHLTMSPAPTQARRTRTYIPRLRRH